ncbi:hypothetical protein ONS95_013919 [Cadophora gregata]|uniref:uncharacterized protein n=1 Tax=Cadophora gregata TaxID=51156 RepID=UPI0026DD9BC3|nr:uncharacterized protein ONS95_013919 [Cadophora gregata]KAK0113671.1 hypothetical protein ONS96_014526 [Cadophora gregata f. sp. sojae]KAK0114428.1 hypothetical protein ONS95_013919 [Cadophora gregata]
MSKQAHHDSKDDTTSLPDSAESVPHPMSITPYKFTKTCHAIGPRFHKRTSFHKFGELPAEIRVLIWEAAMLPRVHELHPCSKLYNERMTFRSNSSRAPSIFHVNLEARSVAMKNYELFDYRPPGMPNGKGILRFYFNPKMDTLLLNSLMGLFVMFMLLDDDVEDYHTLGGLGVMKGWRYVAFDAQRAELVSLLSGVAGHAPQPRFKSIFPAMKQLIIAFDYNSKGKTRFRTSVWPGENGTCLLDIDLPPTINSDRIGSTRELLKMSETIFGPMREYLESDYKEEAGGIPGISFAKVKRKKFIRGDLRYAFRKTCSFVGIKPRGVFRRL